MSQRRTPCNTLALAIQELRLADLQLPEDAVHHTPRLNPHAEIRRIFLDERANEVHEYDDVFVRPEDRDPGAYGSGPDYWVLMLDPADYALSSKANISRRIGAH